MVAEANSNMLANIGLGSNLVAGTIKWLASVQLHSDGTRCGKKLSKDRCDYGH